jgi:hypothetical protein
MRIVLASLLVMFALVSAVSGLTVAQGDPIWIQESKPGGTCWFFPLSGSGSEYDLPATVTLLNETYCVLPSSKTANMHPGEYTLIYQEPVLIGDLYFKDVSFNNGILSSSLSKTKSIDESGRNSQMVLSDLKTIITENKLNTYTEDQITIEKPDVKISTMGQVGDNLYRITGTSNYAIGTKMKIKVDEGRYTAQRDESFTYYTEINATGDDRFTRTWSIDMNMPIQTMPAGWHDFTIYTGELTTTSRFKIEEQKWEASPTPTQFVKYLSDGNIAPPPVVTVVQEKIVTQYIDRWHTATPTPAVTDALGGNVEYPYKRGEQIPGWFGLLASMGIAALVLVRDWKWNR